MRIATWNCNSIRSRVDRAVAFLERHDVDVLALQETKCRDDQFPMMPFQAAGYDVAHVGYNQWNGVAVVSRVGLEDVQVGFEGMPTWGDGDEATAEARAVSAVCAGVRVWSLYVPNGRSLVDPHLLYKLDWLAALRDAGSGWLARDPEAPIALMGDWNIAPTDDDVWSVEYYEGKTHTSPEERAAFAGVVDAGFTDVTREHTPGPGTFTYWDYTRLAFPKRRGMRIDFCLGSPALAGRVEGAFIDREERKGKGASDHAPVVVDLTAA
ncbi:exodeoxyribonuclease III [Ornithinimicrobium pekingense]|uniref:Exodeoxyribonuclease III protein XthA n=1 Tax=Ornithinimicrobium pekingense TaxID=384677 RepID=A0ABQ2F3J5_9MICO|nr:exodeoxyribonuclease III [Ornithinimicrobium pekingense]GGK57320.1 putative exodeoxyribonuclease III protein XthA [Ornithinimicrobium pekingense]